MKKMRLLPSAVLAASLLLCAVMSGCKNKLKEGDVVEKWYEPESSYMMMIPITISDGKNTTTIYQSYWIDDKEDWCVKIKGIYKGEEKTEKVYVSKQQYECLQNGSHLVIGRDCSLSDDNNNKTAR